MGSRVMWIIVGVISFLAGILALANPLAATLTAEMLAGWGFLIVGILQVVFAFRDIGWGARVWAILIGAAFVLTGIALLGNPFAGIISLTMLVAILFLVGGVSKIIISFSLPRGAGFWLMLLSGALSLVLALMIFSNFPQSAAVILGVLLAVELISNGVAMITLGSLRVEA